VQLYPIKPTLKPPRTKRLKLKYDELVSNFDFNFSLRRYSQAGAGAALLRRRNLALSTGDWQGLTLVHFSAQRKRFLWDSGCI